MTLDVSATNVMRMMAKDTLEAVMLRRQIARQIAIDNATGAIYDEIGKILTQNGKEDASGARRCILELIKENNLSKAAQMLGCEEEQVSKLKHDLTYLGSQEFLKQSHT